MQLLSMMRLWPKSKRAAEGDFFAASEAAVADTELRRKLENATGRHLEHVAATRAEFPPYEAERNASRRIKEHAIARLDDLLAIVDVTASGSAARRCSDGTSTATGLVRGRSVGTQS